MLSKKIKFWFLYLIFIISIQMFFFGIYNIPIYKLYCEFNNYYSLDFYNDFFETKLVLFQKLHTILYNESYIFYNINFTNITFFKENIFNTLIFNNYYIFSNIANINSMFFFFDFIYFNIFYILNLNLNVEDIESNYNIIYIVYFNTSITNINLVEFISLQDHIYIYPGETYLVFFRLYNPTNYIIKGISLYLLSPYEVNIYLYKVQCFCFDELLFYPFESVELPILFYIDTNISNYLDFKWILFFQIQIVYLFILNSFTY